MKRILIATSLLVAFLLTTSCTQKVTDSSPLTTGNPVTTQPIIEPAAVTIKEEPIVEPIIPAKVVMQQITDVTFTLSITDGKITLTPTYYNNGNPITFTNARYSFDFRLNMSWYLIEGEGTQKWAEAVFEGRTVAGWFPPLTSQYLNDSSATFTCDVPLLHAAGYNYYTLAIRISENTSGTEVMKAISISIAR